MTTYEERLKNNWNGGLKWLTEEKRELYLLWVEKKESIATIAAKMKRTELAIVCELTRHRNSEGKTTIPYTKHLDVNNPNTWILDTCSVKKVDYYEYNDIKRLHSYIMKNPLASMNDVSDYLSIQEETVVNMLKSTVYSRYVPDYDSNEVIATLENKPVISNQKENTMQTKFQEINIRKASLKAAEEELTVDDFMGELQDQQDKLTKLESQAHKPKAVLNRIKESKKYIEDLIKWCDKKFPD